MITAFHKLYCFLNPESQIMLNTEETARTKRLLRNKRRTRNPLSARRRKRKRSRGLKGQTLSQTAARQTVPKGRGKAVKANTAGKRHTNTKRRRGTAAQATVNQTEGEKRHTGKDGGL